MIINEPEIAASSFKTVKKLWGVEYWIVNTKLYCLKFLKVIPGFQSSIHAHIKKDETFIGMMGDLQLNFHNAEGEVVFHAPVAPGISYRLVPETFHSFQAHNVTWVMEVSTHHDDADVIRLQESRKLEP